MSHFVTLVIVDNREDAESKVEKLLAPFNEGIEVPEYEDADGDTTTYNPLSKWNWYQIGGRWDGFWKGGNVCKLSALPSPVPDDILPYAIITPDGKWHSKGKMLWFGIDTDVKGEWPEQARSIIEQHRDKVGVVCDLHI